MSERVKHYVREGYTETLCGKMWMGGGGFMGLPMTGEYGRVTCQSCLNLLVLEGKSL